MDREWETQPSPRPNRFAKARLGRIGGNMLFAMSINFYYIIIPFVLFLHEMEEWNIVKFHKENYTIQFNETNMTERLWLFMLSLIGVFFGMICTNIPNEVISNSIFLILVTFLLINGLQHILLTIVLKKYNPGFIFGGLLGTALCLLYDIKIVIESVIPLWLFVCITLLEFIPATIDTITSRRRNGLPQMIVQILRFSHFVETKLKE